MFYIHSTSTGFWLGCSRPPLEGVSCERESSAGACEFVLQSIAVLSTRVWESVLHPRYDISTKVLTTGATSAASGSGTALQIAESRKQSTGAAATLDGIIREGITKQRAEHATNPLTTNQRPAPLKAAGHRKHSGGPLQSQALPSFARLDRGRATPVAPRVAQHKTGHGSLHPARYIG